MEPELHQRVIERHAGLEIQRQRGGQTMSHPGDQDDFLAAEMKRGALHNVIQLALISGDALAKEDEVVFGEPDLERFAASSFVGATGPGLLIELLESLRVSFAGGRDLERRTRVDAGRRTMLGHHDLIPDVVVDPLVVKAR